MYSINSKFNSTFRTITKIAANKEAAKSVGENPSMSCSDTRVRNFEFYFLLLDRFDYLTLSENLLLFNFMHFSFVWSSVWGIFGREAHGFPI